MRLTAVFVFLLHFATAQTPQVPHKMNFAGITLTLRDDARREIQKDVDALTQYPKYFNVKVERAKTYFPIIEKIFHEERLPDDFKYLVIQESALIPDAVSVSNAVGFWQFKDFTAIEMGLRVDKEIDERMNIVSSTRAAAQYLKKNNHFFNNWLYALQAYQMGAGGVMRSVNDYESGTRHMEITSKTYWYVKKCLAHKIAFEEAIKGPGEMKVIEYENHTRKSLTEVAREVSVSQDLLSEYNKWAKRGTIPDDRKYVVSVPVQGDARNVYASVAKANSQNIHRSENPKRIEAKPILATASDKKFIHGLPAIKAGEGENASSLSKRAGVNLSFFLACNDLSISDPLIDGQFYYLKRKKTRATVARHKVASSNESLWSISQQYGVQLKRITKLNPGLSATGKLNPGTTITLSSSSTGTVAVYKSQNKSIEVETDGFFDWSLDTKAPVVLASVEYNPVTEPVKESQATTVSSTTGPLEDAVNNTTEFTETRVTDNYTLPNQHIVSAGETLYSISRKYNVGVMDIVHLNQLKLEEGIKPGQVLKLPARGAPENPPVIAPSYILYEVKSSDTLFSVARQYGVTIKEIMDWNSKKDFNLTAGEKLKIQRK